MEIINGITIPFYKFVCNQNLVTEVLEDINTKKFDPDPGQGKILYDYFHHDLFAFFEDSIKQVKKNYYYDNLEFPIVDCWVNEYTPLTRLKRHNHMNSVICGLFYLTNHEDILPTVFEYKNPWTDNDSYNTVSTLDIAKNKASLKVRIYPQAGTLVLFPGNLFHYMEAIKPIGPIHRYTVAFNTYPSGIISNFGTAKLQIFTETVRKRVATKQ